VGVAEAQPGQHLVPAPLVKALVSFEQQLADAKERVGFAPAVPERLVLDPPAHHRRSLAALLPSNRSMTMRRSRSTTEVA
jgi:hypothetical protein